MNTGHIIDALIKKIEMRDAKAVTDMFAEDALFEKMVGTGGGRGKAFIGKLWANFFNDVSKDKKIIAGISNAKLLMVKMRR